MADFKSGLLRRQCTKEYKIEMIEKAIRRELVGLKPRQWMPEGVKVHQCFGIKLDEKESRQSQETV